MIILCRLLLMLWPGLEENSYLLLSHRMRNTKLRHDSLFFPEYILMHVLIFCTERQLQLVMNVQISNSSSSWDRALILSNIYTSMCTHSHTMFHWLFSTCNNWVPHTNRVNPKTHQNTSLIVHATAGMHRCIHSKTWRCYSSRDVQATFQHP